MGQENTGAEDITANLDAAINEETTEESPTSETGTGGESTEATEASSPESKGKTIPYTRFKEVNDAKNELRDELAALQEKFEEQSTSVTQMTQMLNEAKENSDLLKEIQALQTDPNMLPHLEAIDKKLRGVEEVLEQTDGEGKDNTRAELNKLLQSQRDQLEQQQADLQSDILVQKADIIAEKWLEALPEEYTEQDKEIISTLWAQSVDWDKVSASPDSLSDHLKETFQSSIDKFGVPRGGLIDPNDPDSYEIETQQPETPSPEEELLEAIGKKNYGGFKEVDQGGRKSVQAEVSDDEFAADMAKAIRVGRT